MQDLLKTQYFVNLKKYTEGITIAVLLSQQPIEVLHVFRKYSCMLLVSGEGLLHACISSCSYIQFNIL